MNSFTNTILTLLLGWLRTLLNVARDFVSSDSSTAFFDFFRNHWKIIFLVLCVSGFVLDKVVYLIRWRPSPIWIRRYARRVKQHPQPQEAYVLPEFHDNYPAITTNDYDTTMEYQNADTAPTMQYQIQTQNVQPTADTRPAYLPYTTPYYAPEAETPPHWDETSREHTFAPISEQQHFAFGMEPSFGSAQSEPVYDYHREAIQRFAPPQYSPDYSSAEAYATQPGPEQMMYETEDVPSPVYHESNPYFRPFSAHDEEIFAPPKASMFDAVAKKARSLLNADETYESFTYQDLQPTVDVSKAFHPPVYPEKKPEGDA